MACWLLTSLSAWTRVTALTLHSLLAAEVIDNLDKGELTALTLHGLLVAEVIVSRDKGELTALTLHGLLAPLDTIDHAT